MKKLLIIVLLSGFTAVVMAQDSAAKEKKLFVNGYIKELSSISFDKDFRNNISSNLIHNRINLKWKPAERIQLTAEFRNRLFWGEEVKLVPGFSASLKNSTEAFDLQKIWIDNRGLILHSNTERLYIDIRQKKWNARLGRQRINWSMTGNWNSNDIFNAYNFLDFDYEERPGSDAVKFQYLISDLSNIELVYARANKKDIAAARYFINKWNYDFQLIGGWYKNHITLGAGWAGSIKDAGFKGEIQYYFRNQDSAGHLNISTELDYMFKKGWYVDLALFYNNQGIHKPVSDFSKINLNLSPDNLMPTRWNGMLTVVKEFTPLFTANLAVLYSPGSNLLILLPSLQYNLATNLDAGLLWQSFFAESNGKFEAASHRAFIRLKWSF